MYGHTMAVKNNDLTLIMRPAVPGDIPILAQHMSSFEVLRHAGRPVLTERGAEEYFAKQEKAENEISWIVCVVKNGIVTRSNQNQIPIGISSLHRQGIGSRRAVSEFTIFDRTWWRRGIAKLSHVARTYDAFMSRNFLAIESNVDQVNIGSRKALEHVGYVRTGVDYNGGMVNGHTYHSDRFLLVNPNPGPWDDFWGDSPVPKKFRVGRRKTLQALELGFTQVAYL